ncbi:uncharacterized protein LOC111382947 [Olea europaea var. sylvestris]|uniref:uncharacterized protein LOC111382947 n=1 Tax=Olea europaea var. sylvestris TaxID=158386 RepID=UPI000C1D13FE|nr:uncharacterized protein LOC111382947 [Olea europaea var. sylvestris]
MTFRGHTKIERWSLQPQGHFTEATPKAIEHQQFKNLLQTIFHFYFSSSNALTVHAPISSSINALEPFYDLDPQRAISQQRHAAAKRSSVQTTARALLPVTAAPGAAATALAIVNGEREREMPTTGWIFGGGGLRCCVCVTSCGSYCQCSITTPRVPLAISITVQRLDINVVLASSSATTISANVNSIPILNGTNFKNWKENILIVLGCMDLDLALRVEEPTPLTEESSPDERRNFERRDRSNRMSLMIIKHGIPEAFRGAVSEGITNAKEFLVEIEKRFVKNDKAEISTLLQSLISMKYKGKGNIREYIIEMSHIASKLKGLKLELSNDLLVHLVLISLPAKLSQFKVSYNCQKEKWSLNEFISYCVQEDERLKQERTESAHLVSIFKDKGKKKKKEYEAAPKGPAQKKRKEDKDTCFFCHQSGHTKKDCAKYHAWRAKKCTILTLGCLSYRKPSDGERYIYIGDGKSVEVDVIGYCCSFENNQFSLSLNSTIIGTGSLSAYDNLYLFDIIASYNETLHVDSRGTKRKLNKENSATLWHKRLGQILKARVERIVSDGILDSLDFTDFDVCIECIKGKQTKTRRLGSKRTSDVLELIHTNICGPSPTASWNSQQYFISFIDDYSRYGYLYLIHEKSESLDVFKAFKAEVENQLNKRIKSVRFDRGGEYYDRYDGSGEQCPGPFAKYLEECGIVPQYTMPGSPSMNGVAKDETELLRTW